jgi:HEAT repeat protein
VFEPESMRWVLAGDPVLGPLIALIGVGVGIFFAIRAHREWKAAAKELGLEITGFLMFQEMRGEIDGFRIRIRPRGKHGHIDIEVDGQGAIPHVLSLGAENLFTRSLDGEDIQTGHPAFDYRARIFGKPEEAVALLDSATRELVFREVVDEGARVDGGKVTLVHRGMGGVPDLVRRLVALGKRVSMLPAEVPGRLARNAAEDSLSSVRLRNLTLLQERFPALAETLDASRAALASDQPNLRLVGARFLGAEGLDAAEALALSAEVEPDLRRQALQHFFHHTDAGRAVPVLEQLAASSPPAELLPALVEAAGRIRHVPTLERLLGQADGLGDSAVASLAGAVAEANDAAAEEGLLRLLTREAAEVRAAAARALGQVGTVHAVEPLLALTEGLLTSPSVKQAARQAVARIQSRLGDAEAGRLSLAVPAEGAGALSLPGEERAGGELSLPDKDAVPEESNTSN